MRQGQHGNQGSRQGQQNKRMRGRSRKSPNQLNRSYESNGPDVKIRGTAAHIAEKYAVLSRDAQASGDPVASENYMQHAEHYSRIVAAAQAQIQSQQPPQGNSDNDSRESQKDNSSRNGNNAPRGAETETATRADNNDAAQEGNDTESAPRPRRRPRNTAPKAQTESSNGATGQMNGSDSEPGALASENADDHPAPQETPATKPLDNDSPAAEPQSEDQAEQPA